MREKILSLAELDSRLLEERRAGRTVAFANGCFDLLHVGHLRYLEGAKGQGDVLVVGVNSDRSVARLKGEGRPLIPEKDRAFILAGLACVDYLFLFDEPTVEAALHRIRPDVHCKGSDYQTDTIPEGEIARSLGARLAITGGPKSFSTTDLLDRIRKTIPEKSDAE